MTQCLHMLVVSECNLQCQSNMGGIKVKQRCKPLQSQSHNSCALSCAARSAERRRSTLEGTVSHMQATHSSTAYLTLALRRSNAASSCCCCCCCSSVSTMLPLLLPVGAPAKPSLLPSSPAPAAATAPCLLATAGSAPPAASPTAAEPSSASSAAAAPAAGCLLRCSKRLGVPRLLLAWLPLP
jgi:hypothetical protein